MLDGTNGPTAVIGRAALQIDLSIGEAVFVRLRQNLADQTIWSSRRQ